MATNSDDYEDNDYDEDDDDDSGDPHHDDDDDNDDDDDDDGNDADDDGGGGGGDEDDHDVNAADTTNDDHADHVVDDGRWRRCRKRRFCNYVVNVLSCTCLVSLVACNGERLTETRQLLKRARAC